MGVIFVYVIDIPNIFNRQHKADVIGILQILLYTFYANNTNLLSFFLYHADTVD